MKELYDGTLVTRETLTLVDGSLPGNGRRLLNSEEIAEKQAQKDAWEAGAVARVNAEAERNREAAYRTEADALYFKYRRGEATEQEWLDKVSEIKARFPKEEK